MDRNNLKTDRQCPDCGTALELKDDGAYFCAQENVRWIAYGPKLLIQQPTVRELSLSLRMPWESNQAA